MAKRPYKSANPVKLSPRQLNSAGRTTKRPHKSAKLVKLIYSYAVVILVVGVAACVSYFSEDNKKHARRNAAHRIEQVQKRNTAPAEAEVIYGRCEYVQDGDSLLFIPRGENTEVKVRLFGVDAPERDQDWADESRENLRKLIDEQEIRLQVVDVDQYGRSVAKVYVGNTYVNLEQLKAGMAWLYEYYCDPKQDADLISAARTAESGRVGLWSDSSALNPREHRRRYGTVHDGR